MPIPFKLISKKDCTDSGMALTLLFLLIGHVFFSVPWMSIAAIVALVVTMTSPMLIKPFAWLWLNFSLALGTVMSKVILSVLFFSLVTPIGLLVRLFRKDALQTKAFKKGSDSVFKNRNTVFKSIDLINPY